MCSKHELRSTMTLPAFVLAMRVVRFLEMLDFYASVLAKMNMYQQL